MRSQPSSIPRPRKNYPSCLTGESTVGIQNPQTNSPLPLPPSWQKVWFESDNLGYEILFRRCSSPQMHERRRSNHVWTYAMFLSVNYEKWEKISCCRPWEGREELQLWLTLSIIVWHITPLIHWAVYFSSNVSTIWRERKHSEPSLMWHLLEYM